MCICHYFDKTENKMKHKAGLFSLKTANVGDIFRFEHETFKRIVIEFKLHETVAVPMEEEYAGMSEGGINVFHNSFKAIWGEV